MTTPELSVVVPTHNRARRLSLLLDSLRAQTLPSERFEVIVVNDGSSDATGELLERAALDGGLTVRVIRYESARGPAAARNAGWRAARAPLIAFTDDDCVAAPGWIAAGLRVAAEYPGAVIQGRVDINPAEHGKLSVFAHTFEVHDTLQGFPTCNIFYPRALLEELDGFDETFRLPAGEDTDLGLRALEAGHEVVFADAALAYHGVLPVGALARLRSALRWTDTIRNYPRHPALRKELILGIFWRVNHLLLARFLLGLALPRRYGPLRLALAAPYVAHLTNRRTGPLVAPYLLALDLVEVFAVVRGAIRYRTPVV